jgi:hypothetical protein
MLCPRRILGTALLACGIAWTCTPTGASAQRMRVSDEVTDDGEHNELPWRGSRLVFGQTINPNAFGRAAQLSYDPRYALTLDLELQWHFSPTLFASIDQGLQVELTDSDSTVERQQLLLTDTSLALDSLLWEQSLTPDRHLVITAGAQLLAPTSLASQAATVVLGTRARTGLALVVDDAFSGLTVHAGAGYLHRFVRSDTAEPDAPYPCVLASRTVGACTHLGGFPNATDVVVTSLVGQASFGRDVTLDLAFALGFSKAPELVAARVDTLGGEVVVADQSATHWRMTRSIALALSYTFTDWLDLTFGVANSFSERGVDGELREPFNPVDMLFGLDLTLALDRIYLMSTGAAPRTSYTEHAAASPSPAEQDP